MGGVAAILLPVLSITYVPFVDIAKAQPSLRGPSALHFQAPKELTLLMCCCTLLVWCFPLSSLLHCFCANLVGGDTIAIFFLHATVCFAMTYVQTERSPWAQLRMSCVKK